MIRTKSGAAGALDRLQRAADRAQARRRGDHRLDRDPHRGGPLADRPGRLGDRLRLGPQGRRAGRRRAPLRPREGREPGGGDRGDADPGRRRDHRLRGDPPAGRRRRGRAPRRRHRGDRLLGRSPTSVVSTVLSRQARRTTRRRSRATPPTCAPTRSPRSASSSAWRWSRSPATPPSTRSRRWSSPRRSSSPGSGSSAAPPACSSTKRCRAEEMDRIEAAIAGRPHRPRSPATTSCAPAAPGAAATSTSTSSSAPGTSLERAHELAHQMRDAIEAEIPATPRS